MIATERIAHALEDIAKCLKVLIFIQIENEANYSSYTPFLKNEIIKIVKEFKGE